MTETGARREYKLAADPIKRRDLSPMREILELADDRRSVLAVVPDEYAMDVLHAIRRAYQDGREDRGSEDGPIGKGSRVRLIDPPGFKVPYGTVGVAEEAPGDGGLFWVQFPQGRMHARAREVELVREGDHS